MVLYHFHKKKTLGLDGAVSVLGSLWKCQKSKVHKISGRYDMFLKNSTPILFFFWSEKKNPDFFWNFVFWVYRKFLNDKKINSNDDFPPIFFSIFLCTITHTHGYDTDNLKFENLGKNTEGIIIKNRPV